MTTKVFNAVITMLKQLFRIQSPSKCWRDDYDPYKNKKEAK